jgi:outer membrane protein TolC
LAKRYKIIHQQIKLMPLRKWILIFLLAFMGAGIAKAAPMETMSVPMLERSWSELNKSLNALDQLLPPDPSLPTSTSNTVPALPPALLQANRSDGTTALSLNQALAIGFQQNPNLQIQRLAINAALDNLQAQLGTYWPRIVAVAGAGYGQINQGFGVPAGTTLFPENSPFYVPTGATATLSQASRNLNGGFELSYELIDFARTPAIKAARARLQLARQNYANGLRELQLRISEAYYLLQRSDQLVRIRDADVRNDLVVLNDVLALKQAGLVPRLDLLRRQSIEATSQEFLVQALADRAVARRKLAVALNLAPEITPVASDPIQLQPRWPLDLETSLLEAYRDNPELEALLATREALLRDQNQMAAKLLPKLSFMAAGGAGSQQISQFNVSGDCCGTTVIPTLNNLNNNWLLGLSFRWLLFDAGTSAAQVRSLGKQAEIQNQRFIAQRNDIRLRLEQAFFNHEASLVKILSARRAVAASLEGFRDAKLRYQTGLANEVTLSLTQDQLVRDLVRRLEATIDVNVSYAQLLRELLPVSRDPNHIPTPQLILNP